MPCSVQFPRESLGAEPGQQGLQGITATPTLRRPKHEHEPSKGAFDPAACTRRFRRLASVGDRAQGESVLEVLEERHDRCPPVSRSGRCGRRSRHLPYASDLF